MCRQGNALADALAKRARLSSPLLVWMESVPPDLYNCYLLDFSSFILSSLSGWFLKKRKKKEKKKKKHKRLKVLNM